MKKKLTAMLLVIAVTAVMFSGCSKEEKNKEQSSGKSIKVSIMYGKEGQGEIYKEIADDFQKKNPDIKVKLVYDFSDSQKLKDAVSDKGDTDIIGIKRSNLIEFAKSGLLMDISAFIDENGLNSKLYGICSAYGKFNEKYYGIGDTPMSIEWFYNKDMLDRNKIAVPKTSDELVAACKKIKGKNISPVVTGALNGWTLTTLFGMITAQTTGAESLTSAYGAGTSGLSQVKGMDAAFKEYDKILKVMPLSSEDINYRQSVDDFVKGKAAFLPTGSWTVKLIEQIKSKGFNYGILDPAIKFSSAPVTMYSATANQVLAVSAKTKNKDNVYKFLKYFYSPEAQQKFADKGYTPALKEADRGSGQIQKIISSHLESTDTNSVMLLDNIEPGMLEKTTFVLKDMMEGRVKAEEAWPRVIKLVNQQ